MPIAGKTALWCDYPVQFDTYRHCSYQCKYCYVYSTESPIVYETPSSLRRWISGERNVMTNWCDWDIPLRWGVVSDPFQHCEAQYQNSYQCLKVFADTNYPVIITTKSVLVGKKRYLDMIRQCRVVLQISLCAPLYDNMEYAPTYKERFEMLSKLTPHCRVLLRIQPYIPGIKDFVLAKLPVYRDMGIYGIIVESMKMLSRQRVLPGMIWENNQYRFPVSQIKQDYNLIRGVCTDIGLHFFCGEDILRGLSESLSCCGCDDLGFNGNHCNLNYHNIQYTDRMKLSGTGNVFRGLNWSIAWREFCKYAGYQDVMEQIRRSIPCV